MPSLNEEQAERLVVAQEKIAEQLTLGVEKLGDILTVLNKSPWDDPKTKALLQASLFESGMSETVAQFGFETAEDESNV